MPISYDWKKKFGVFEIRVRDILTYSLRFEGTIYFNKKGYRPYLVSIVRGRTLHKAKKKALNKLRDILEHSTRQILNYTGEVPTEKKK